MSDIKSIGRLGGLALGLGIGAALAAAAGTAVADPVWPSDPNVAAAWSTSRHNSAGQDRDSP